MYAHIIEFAIKLSDFVILQINYQCNMQNIDKQTNMDKMDDQYEFSKLGFPIESCGKQDEQNWVLCVVTKRMFTT